MQMLLKPQEFESPAQPLDMEQLGSCQCEMVLNPDHGNVMIFRHRLAEANQYVRVRPEGFGVEFCMRFRPQQRQDLPPLHVRGQPVCMTEVAQTRVTMRGDSSTGRSRGMVAYTLPACSLRHGQGGRAPGSAGTHGHPPSTRCSVCCHQPIPCHPGSGPLQDLHARLQPLLIFFIDAANYIDDGAGGVDPRWELYLATELTAAGRIIVSCFA